jgi:hypothetical protein
LRGVYANNFQLDAILFEQWGQVFLDDLGTMRTGRGIEQDRSYHRVGALRVYCKGKRKKMENDDQ